MTITGAFAVFLVGCAGGVLAEMLHWYCLRDKPERPQYATSPFYWTLTAGMVLAGGLICWLYFGATVEGPVGLHIGASTPILLQKLFSTVPEQSGARALLAPKASLRSFFTW